MFRSRGLFKDVPCPGKHDCTLPNCLFLHDGAHNGNDPSGKNQVYDPASLPTESDSPPPAKRRRLDSDTSESTLSVRTPAIDSGRHVSSKTINNELLQKSPARGSNGVRPTIGSQPNSTPRPQPASVASSNATPTIANRLNSVTRPVSPPVTKYAAKEASSPSQPTRKPIQPEDYKPRKVEKSPAPFPKRLEYIEKLKKMIADANTRMRKEFPKEPDLHLNEAEIKAQAMDEEERAANANPNIDSYKMALGQRLMYFTPKKMTSDEWRKFMSSTWLLKPETTSDGTAKEPPKIESGLDSVGKEVAVLKLLRCGLNQYQQYGYITKPPSKKEVDDAAKTIKTMGNSEICDRCTTRFQVFPGRNSVTGELTTRGECHYHWARLPFRGPKAIYPCCNGTAGSTGCTTCPTHVFKTTEPARLALTLPFEETPQHNDSKPRPPVVFDCEMAYTTHGMELIRVTALSWPTNQTLLDVLVRPIGEILDLNTRFSGVTPTLFTSAPDFGHGPPPRYNDTNKTSYLLQKVASPKAARSLLFDHLNPDTPLIGHAIENDLTACRIIHPFVIDTVLLYPHPKGLPARYKLRDLASMYLGRKIQRGGEEVGHDSREDSEATGDLALVMVKKRWEGMKGEGWTWKGDLLIPPSRRSGATGNTGGGTMVRL